MLFTYACLDLHPILSKIMSFVILTKKLLLLALDFYIKYESFYYDRRGTITISPF